jgi:pimeloyl-ACP methyl ester carboxylesterase
VLAFDRHGSGPPLVLVHGIGSRRGVWDPVVPALAREREVLAVDLPGFGASEPLPAGTAPNVAALVDALVAWWAELGIDRPHVAGNSLGGGLALELARAGAVESATALSPIGFWSPPEKHYGRVVLRTSRFMSVHAGAQLTRLLQSRVGRAAAIGHMYGRPGRKDPREAALDVEQLASARGWDATLDQLRGYDFRDGAQLDPVPVTIGWGTRDRLLVPRQAERARVALPHARHVPLPGCGHIPMSDDPEGVAALLLAGSGGATPLAGTGSNP